MILGRTSAWNLVLILLVSQTNCQDNSEFCNVNEDTECINQLNRYVLYDVNPPEGFNLRRDVYLRFAIFAHKLVKRAQSTNLENFKLVLPPWCNLYHWREESEPLPWSYFFDLQSLQAFAPVVEMHQFFDEMGIKYSKLQIDEVFILQNFEDMFETGKFEDKMSIEKCNKPIQTSFYHYDNVTSKNIKCLSFHGHASQLTQILENSNARTILFDHAEIALHDSYGDKIYWQARRSMRFNKKLVTFARKFRHKYLNSTDELDDTKLPENWESEQPRRTAKGGPYLSVHLRRRDFAWGRPKDVPSIANAAKQIEEFLLKLGLTAVYIATDATDKEYVELQKLLSRKFQVYRYIPNTVDKEMYKEGGIAIIDQIICAHAKYFVGTYESTFSFRIQEEREILGFPVESTFNRLCGDDATHSCERPSVWKIVY